MEDRRMFQNNSSPLATVEEIQRRLVRPPSLQFHSPNSAISQISNDRNRNRRAGYSSQLTADATEFQMNRKQVTLTNNKLEDYLDPFLLSTICSKISSNKRKIDHHQDRDMIKRKKFHEDFKWPFDELKVFDDVPNRGEIIEFRSEKRHRRSDEAIIDLKSDEAIIDLKSDDLDPIGDHEDEDSEELLYTPFEKFEMMASKQFNRGEG